MSLNRPQNGSPVTLAGVCEWWKARDESVVRTFAILTTAANATMRQLHERMPVILEPDAWSLWLGDTVAAVDLMRLASDDAVAPLAGVARGQLGSEQ